MTDSEFLARFDRHVERMDGHLQQGHQLMTEIREEMRLSREEIRSSRDEVRSSQEERGDLRTFIREITVRQERVTQQLVEQIAEGTRELRDVSLASRQHTQALGLMLDRLN
ncbi:MAG: hypothetical protein ACR2K6_07715 [Solirubrobacterales bacterium]